MTMYIVTADAYVFKSITDEDFLLPLISSLLRSPVPCEGHLICYSDYHHYGDCYTDYIYTSFAVPAEQSLKQEHLPDKYPVVQLHLVVECLAQLEESHSICMSVSLRCQLKRQKLSRFRPVPAMDTQTAVSRHIYGQLFLHLCTTFRVTRCQYRKHICNSRKCLDKSYNCSVFL